MAALFATEAHRVLRAELLGVEQEDAGGYEEFDGPVVRTLRVEMVQGSSGSVRTEALVGAVHTSFSYPRKTGGSRRARYATVVSIASGAVDQDYTTSGALSRTMARTWAMGTLAPFRTRARFDAALMPHQRSNARAVAANVGSHAPEAVTQSLARIVAGPLSAAFIRLFMAKLTTLVTLRAPPSHYSARTMGAFFGHELVYATLAKLASNARLLWTAKVQASPGACPPPPTRQDLVDARTRLREWMPSRHAALVLVQNDGELLSVLLMEWALMVLREALPVSSWCVICGMDDGDNHRCSRCHVVFYCSRVCQARDWAAHRRACVSVDMMGASPLDQAIATV